MTEDGSLDVESADNIGIHDPDQLKRKIEDLENRLILLEFAVQDRTDEKVELLELIQERENSLSWKLCQVYGRIIPPGSSLTKMITAFLTRIVQVIPKKMPVSGHHHREKNARLKGELAGILQENKDSCRGIILVPPTCEWNIPLFQRPQQLSLALAGLDYLVFFSSWGEKYDTVSGFHKITNRCYITDQYPFLVEELPPFYCLLPSTYVASGVSEIRKLKNKSVIIYDYLDEISDRIIPFPLDMLRRHHGYLLRNADIILATAGSLYDEARKKRGNDVFFIPNGVEYSHFHILRDRDAIPPDLLPIISRENPVIGYFGAFATWFDYGLITELAEKRPLYEIVLIGWDYDGSMRDKGLEKYPNIHYIGPKEYAQLPAYAVWFDVCTIPFLINEITQATSPIKLFEYMALGNPIVTTEMAECLKYPSVLIGKTHEEFIGKIDQALTYRQNRNYLELLDTEARENTWAARAADIDTILQSVDRKKRED
ncbi:MAG: glycosyltransferase [Methanoregula sp.]